MHIQRAASRFMRQWAARARDHAYVAHATRPVRKRLELAQRLAGCVLAALVFVHRDVGAFDDLFEGLARLGEGEAEREAYADGLVAREADAGGEVDHDG